MPKRCPPGVICVNETLGLGFVLVGVGILVYFLYQSSSAPSASSRAESTGSPPIQIVNSVRGGDDRYTRAPEPLRFWQTGPDLRGAYIPPGAVPINQPTRGLPQSYQQMGIIKSGDKLLPLYGRQSAYRSDRYNYYTRTDTYNPVQLPVHFEKRDCTDQVGCSEILGGEHVKIAGLNTEGQAEIYKFDGPTYIPGLV